MRSTGIPCREEVDSELVPHIQNLQWWDDAGLEGIDPKKLWFFHPVRFLEHLRRIVGLRVTIEMLRAVGARGDDKYLNGIALHINRLAHMYGVNDKHRMCHFLSQIGHESRFRIVEENLNYSETNMKKVFGCSSGGWVNGNCLPEKRRRLKLWNSPSMYANNPENLGNYVYANRLGNGSEASGEGYKYRGRGLIQLTGKSNYRMYTEVHNRKNPNDQQDFVAFPDLVLSSTEYGVESAFVWWDMNKMNQSCTGSSDEDIRRVTKRVNGGYNGLEDRMHLFRTVLKIIER